MRLYPNVTIVFCIWAFSILTIFYFSFTSFPRIKALPQDFLSNFAIWDGGHYVRIAEFGYREKNEYTFFPAYPILINLLTRLTGNFTVSGILITVAATFLGLQIFYKLVLVEFGRKNASNALLALLFFPMSFYFLTVYTEGLFFLLAVFSFLSIRRNNFLAATIAASLASATKITGLALVFGLWAYVYFSRGFDRKNWFVLFAPLGFIAYSLYLYFQTGDPFYFIQAESHYWKQGLVFPGSAFIHSFKQIITPGFILGNFRDLLDFLFAIFGIIMFWTVWKKLSIDYIIYSLFALVLPLFSPTLAAFPRYLLTIFPLFIALSFYKNTYITIFYQIICLMLTSLYIVLFINGYWTS